MWDLIILGAFEVSLDERSSFMSSSMKRAKLDDDRWHESEDPSKDVDLNSQEIRPLDFIEIEATDGSWVNPRLGLNLQLQSINLWSNQEILHYEFIWQGSPGSKINDCCRLRDTSSFFSNIPFPFFFIHLLMNKEKERVERN